MLTRGMQTHDLRRASSTQRLSILLVSLVVALTTLTFSSASPAQAADRYTGITSIDSVTADPANKRIRITYTNKRDLPGGAQPSGRVAYRESIRGGYMSSGRFSTKKGRHTLNLSTRGNLHVVRVEVYGVRGATPRNYTRLVRPGTFTRQKTVTSGQAAANAIAVNVPGAVLTFVPQSRTIRFAGGALLGWTISRDVRESITGSGSSCPRLKKGQVIRHSTTWSQSGTRVKKASTFRVWTSVKAKRDGRAPACTRNFSTTYR